MRMRVRGSRVGPGVDAPVAAALEALMEGKQVGVFVACVSTGDTL